VTDVVVDASVLVFALIGGATPELRRYLVDAHTHAPHLVDAEVADVLRRHELAGLITVLEAETARRVAPRLVDHRYPHTAPLSDRAWSLRHNLSFYDALYVALAEQLDVPLLTVDVRMAKAPDLPCTVELVGPPESA